MDHLLLSVKLQEKTNSRCFFVKIYVSSAKSVVKNLVDVGGCPLSP